MLTIVYSTNRKNPRIHWFFDSLRHQLDDTPVKVVVVSRYSSDLWLCPNVPPNTTFINPKPNVWQGPYRLTTQDYFAASNTRNTGLLHAEDGYIAYVDDLSVLLPGWFQQVKEAMAGGWIACGSYVKVKNLSVANGEVHSFDGVENPFNRHELTWQNAVAAAINGFPAGIDSRIKPSGGSSEPFPCGGSWMFGASVAMPVEALLSIGGWDHRADSMGGEDYLCGIMLEKAGYQLKYCKRMMTLESEEAHHEEPPLRRIIKGPPGKTDASWMLLNLVMNDPHPTVPDEYGNGGIREARKRVLAGGPMPIVQTPQHHFYDGQPLSQM